MAKDFPGLCQGAPPLILARPAQLVQGETVPPACPPLAQDGERLAPDQLAVLNSICLAFSQELKVSSSTFVVVDVLSVTVFTCRSLEKKLANFQAGETLPPSLRLLLPSPWHRRERS